MWVTNLNGRIRQNPFGWTQVLTCRVYLTRMADKLSNAYGDVIKSEGVIGGILIPEHSPGTAGVMPFERAVEVNAFHPEFIPIANLNPHYHEDLPAAFEEQLAKGARGLKKHSVHGMFFANDRLLYPIYERCEQTGLPVFSCGNDSVQGRKDKVRRPILHLRRHHQRFSRPYDRALSWRQRILV